MAEPAAKKSAELALRPGVTLDGKYRLESLIGEGGMGVVWQATQIDLERPVAIKVVRPEFAGNEEVVERTVLEARAAAQLRGEHIVRILDVSRLESGSPYIVMEHLDGNDLFAELAGRGPLPIEDAVEFVLQACEGLAEAHSIGIVHRDLKPENLFAAVQPDGRVQVKILDFGISKHGGAERARSMTNPGTIVGSPHYMAPEQMRGSPDIDARADVWSLGAILYELITSVAAFDADSVPAVCTKVLEGRPLPPRHLRADVPEDLEAIILQCLEKDPAHRFATVGELAHRLSAFGSASAGDRAERITRIISGIRPRVSSMPARLSHDANTLRAVQRRAMSSASARELETAAFAPRRRGRAKLLASFAVVCTLGGLATFFVVRPSQVAHASTGVLAPSAARRLTARAATMASVSPNHAEPSATSDASVDLPGATAATSAVPSAAPAIAPVRSSSRGRVSRMPTKAESGLSDTSSSSAQPAPTTSPRDAWDPKSFGGRR